MGAEIFGEGGQSSLANLGLPLFTIPRRTFELRQQIERDIGRLIIRRIGPSYVRAQRPDRGLAWKNILRLATHPSAAPGDQSRSDRFHVSFHTRNLPREKNI